MEGRGSPFPYEVLLWAQILHPPSLSPSALLRINLVEGVRMTNRGLVIGRLGV